LISWFDQFSRWMSKGGGIKTGLWTLQV
jgi:hypothetical protein